MKGRVNRRAGSAVGCKNSQSFQQQPTSKKAVYEVEEEPDKEFFKFQGVDGGMDSDMNSDFEDEEIDDDEAFNEQDEQKYGEWFEDDGASEDGQEDEDDESDEMFDDIDEQRLLDEEEEEDDDGDVLQQEDIDNLLEKVHHVDRSEQKYKERMKNLRDNVVVEAVPEGQFNLSSNSQQGELSIGDLLGALGEKEVKKLGGVRKSLEKLQRKGPSNVPLSKSLKDRETRKAAYEYRSKETGKWLPIVKANREVQTVEFTSGREFLDHTINTTALAEKFTPQTELEKEVAVLLKASRADTAEAVLEAEEELAMKQMSVEELRARHDRLAKMKAQMFREETKAKRIKKIKSKSYRKRLRKAIAKQDEVDPEDEAAMEAARQEFEFQRAKERVTLRHKNTGKYIRRKLKVIGFQNLRADEQMQIAEQNRIAQEFKKKAEDMKQKNSSEEDNSSSTDSDESEQEYQGQKALGQADSKLQKAAIKMLRGEDEEDEEDQTKKGLFALPFMKRAIQKKKLENKELAKQTLQELDHPNAKYDDDYDKMEKQENLKKKQKATTGGKMVFGANASTNGYVVDTEQQNDGYQSDSDDDRDQIPETRQQWKAAVQTEQKEEKQRDKKVTFQIPENQNSQNEPLVSQQRPKFSQSLQTQQTSFTENGSNDRKLSRSYQIQSSRNSNGVKVSEGQEEKDMMEWTQEDIIREAFAGDNVEAEFLEEKQEVAGIEIPDHLKQVDILPGWGSWARSKNTAARIQQAKDKARAEQVAAASKRKDASLKRVIISEKWDKKAAELMVKEAPYPHTKETFNAQLRMPIGKEYNTRESFKDFTRPEVIKRAGTVVEPLQYDKDFQKNEDVVGFKRKTMIVAAGQPRPGKLARES